MEKLIKISQERSKRINKIEKLKQEHTPQEAWEKLEYYAEKGFSSIPEHDLNYFLKCFGIFYRPATPERFMLRVRIPGGRLNSEQARMVGKVAKRYGKDYIDITTRMQVELRYLRIEDIPQVLKDLESVGITTFQTGVDNFRNIVQDPLDAVAFDSVIETWDILQNIQKIFLKKEEWICKLPRKFNIGILGSFANRCNIYGHDLAFVLAEKNGVFGFNVYLGGKVGAIARSGNRFVNSEEVPVFFEALAKVFKKYGFKDSRNKNRLKYMIDAVGMEEVISAVEHEAQRKFEEAGRTLTYMEGGEINGKVLQKDGKFSIHMTIPSGIFSGSAMIEVADLSEKFGSGEIRLSVSQNLYILGVDGSKLEELLSTPIFKKYKNVDTPYFNDLIACAGTEHCPFGVIPNKPDAIEVSKYLSENYPIDPLKSRVRMYWSACQKGCGIHGNGDIGFVGVKFRENKETKLGVDMYIGGTLTGESEEGRLLIKSIPLEKTKYYVEELIKEYIRLKKDTESFESFYNRVLTRLSKGAIRFLIVFNNLIKNKFDWRLEITEHILNKSSEEEEIFVFGYMIYKHLTAKNPYTRPNLLEIYDEPSVEKPSKYNKFISKDFEKVILKMLDKRAEKRYKVFTEVEEDLKKVLG